MVISKLTFNWFYLKDFNNKIVKRKEILKFPTKVFSEENTAISIDFTFVKEKLMIFRLYCRIDFNTGSANYKNDINQKTGISEKLLVLSIS